MTFDWQTVKISPEALEGLAAVGVKGDLFTKARSMLRFSVPFSHPRGNRRFAKIMFLIENGVLQSIAPIDFDPKVEAAAAKSKAKLDAKHEARRQS